MKIIIAKDGIKREIEGPFNICANKEDLKILTDSIERADIDYYGWVVVCEMEDFAATANRKPLKWNES